MSGRLAVVLFVLLMALWTCLWFAVYFHLTGHSPLSGLLGLWA